LWCPVPFLGMGMIAKGRIDIAKPATEVFSWLIEPAKLTSWAGSPGVMPADPEVLAVGYENTGPVPGIAGGEARMRVEAWNPPVTFAVTVSYAGGEAMTTYGLAESGGLTTLTCSSDTDWATPDLGAVEAQIAAQPLEVQAAMHHAIDVMNRQVDAGAFDVGTQAMMQQALEASLVKLKQLAEAG
jgi:hypothetical protein